MIDLWFAIVAGCLVVFVVLDGFDLGTGALLFRLGKDERSRAAVLRTLHPTWDGNEVWLLAGGASLALAFPGLYASLTSGFYLALVITLWLLVLRGVTLELRDHLAHPVWRQGCDGGFLAASAGLVLVVGLVLGNLARGIPTAPDGSFFLPLWTDLVSVDPPGVVDVWTLAVAAATALELLHHGALWVAAHGDPGAAALARRLWWGATLGAPAALGVLALGPSPLPGLLLHDPLALGLALVAAALHVGARALECPLRAFLSSSAALALGLASMGVALHPYGLPAPAGTNAIALESYAASPGALRVGLWWCLPGMALVVLAFVWTYRRALTGARGETS